MKYLIQKIIDKVYLVRFEVHYELCMFFLRYQEYYESPNPKFRNHAFTISDFMDWYVKDKNADYFSYPADWGGFNIPSRIIDDVRTDTIQDFNRYDLEMFQLHSKLSQEAGSDYYLIGVSGPADKNAQMVDHELAHGMYYTIPEYKAKMDKLVKACSPKLRTNMNAWLKDIGYTKEVYVDETQAYLSTGFHGKFATKRASKPFIKVFQEFKSSQVRNSSKS